MLTNTGDTQADDMAKNLPTTDAIGAFDPGARDSLPLVSVVVPLYNNGPTVLRAVMSALSQEGVRTEVIVVDDGSTDQGEEGLWPVAGRYHYLRQENSGVAAARNRGMSAASGDYIAFLDADDYWLPGFLDATTTFLRDHPSCEAVSSAYYLTEGPTRRIMPGVLRDDPEGIPAGPLDDFFGVFGKHGHVWTGAVVLHRDVVLRAGDMRTDLRFGEDQEYWLFIGTFTNWGFITEPLAIYNYGRPDSLTSTSVRARLFPDIDLWQARFLPRLTSRQLVGYESYRARLAGYWFGELFAAKEARQARSLARSGYVPGDDKLGLLARYLKRAPLPAWTIAVQGAHLWFGIRARGRHILHRIPSIRVFNAVRRPSSSNQRRSSRPLRRESGD